MLTRLPCLHRHNFLPAFVSASSGYPKCNLVRRVEIPSIKTFLAPSMLHCPHVWSIKHAAILRRGSKKESVRRETREGLKSANLKTLQPARRLCAATVPREMRSVSPSPALPPPFHSAHIAVRPLREAVQARFWTSGSRSRRMTSTAFLVVSCQGFESSTPSSDLL